MSGPSTTPTPGPAQLGRRPVLQVLGGAAIGALGTTAATRAAAAGGAGRTDTAALGLRSTTTSSDPSAGEHPLGPDDFTRRSDGRWRSDAVAVPGTTMVAVTWAAGAPHGLLVRSRHRGRWRPARHLHHQHDLPDGGTGEGRAAGGGTQLVWVRGADRVQVVAGGHHAPTGLTLVVIDAAPRPGDAGVDDRAASRPTVPAHDGVPAQPTVISRADWGADESWRSGSPRYNQTIKQAHVHHTASGNDYTRDEVPGILRGIYRYHTHNLGWSDVGYNFLVDRFGRTWEGRAGGIARPVRGAHTLGFNATSTGISVIGNYERVQPTAAALEAIVAVAAWKLGLYGRTATARTEVVSQGSDLYPPGRSVSLPVIDGHRDTNDTACPGSLLYDHLPAIRQSAQDRLDAAGTTPAPIHLTTPFALVGFPVPGQALTVGGGTWTPTDAVRHVAWYRDATRLDVPDLVAYRLTVADVGAVVSAHVTLQRPGSPDVEVTLPCAVPVAQASVVRVSATVSGHDVTVSATVDPGGPAPADGSVDVVLSGHRRSLPLAGGAASAVFGGIDAGHHLLSASYPGSTTPGAVQGSTMTTTVNVAGA